MASLRLICTVKVFNATFFSSGAKLMAIAIDMTGEIFGSLRIKSLHSRDGRRTWYNCVCVCGKSFTTRSDRIRRGRVRSCGCINPGRLTHGMSRSSTYRCYQSMIQRCYNPNRAVYHHYGGRGIKVCKRWLKSFENFLEDMGEKPLGLSIDRYPNNDGDYKKSNCRWATQSEQLKNRRRK